MIRLIAQTATQENITGEAKDMKVSHMPDVCMACQIKLDRDAEIQVARMTNKANMVLVTRMESQYRRKFSAIVKRGMRSSSDGLFYAQVQIPLLINIGATSFCERDIDNANQILTCQQ